MYIGDEKREAGRQVVHGPHSGAHLPSNPASRSGIGSWRNVGGVLAVDLRRRLVADPVGVEGVGVSTHGRAAAGEVNADALPRVGFGGLRLAAMRLKQADTSVRESTGIRPCSCSSRKWWKTPPADLQTRAGAVG